MVRIFKHWQEAHHHQHAALDDKRVALIRKALKHYTADQLCQSISGFLNSPHHAGDNQRNTKYDSIELLLRDSAHIDMGLKFYVEPPGMKAEPKKLTAEEQEWKALTDDARLEQFRAPIEHEPIEKYRAALKRHTNDRAQAHLAKMGGNPLKAVG